MIELTHLEKYYDKQCVLNNLNCVLPDRGLQCLVGPSGCGKTTLFNIIAGFDCNYSGEITVNGTPISKMSMDDLSNYRKDNIGFIFQDYHLLPGYTVLENLLLPCELKDKSPEENLENAKELLHKLNLTKKLNAKIENLSGGQKQRVAIGRALINQPSIILADEPTGALDRRNSTEIMNLLKELSNDCLVLVITHDLKICDFADNVLSIEEGKLIDQCVNLTSGSQSTLKVTPTQHHSVFPRAFKNFNVHIARYIAVSLAISIGVLAFMLSLSSSNMIKNGISDFKEKNTAFNNGYVRTEKDSKKILAQLKSDQRVKNVYAQYILKNISLSIGDKKETMTEKYPMAKAMENMSYGIMPKRGQRSIALSPSLAKKIATDIESLIGQELSLKYKQREYTLTVSGIFNAEYDDFYISSDIEQELYRSFRKEIPYSVSYDVTNFEHIVPVSQHLLSKGVDAKTAATEVSALQNTFQQLQRLFMVVSLLILSIAVFIGIVLLKKLANSRYREVGLLAALGFSKGQIRWMIINENMLLAGSAAIFNALQIAIAYWLSNLLTLNLTLSLPQISLSIMGTVLTVLSIGTLTSHSLTHTEPAVALRK